MRERLVAALSWLFTRAAILAAPKPRVPLSEHFAVIKDPDGDLVVTLLFVKQDIMPAAEWHIVALIEYPDHPPLLMDSGVGRCYVWHLDTPADPSVIVRRAYEPEYEVLIRCKSTGAMPHTTIGPVTCVTLAKRLIGVHNPGIVTSRQLLALLWEMRNGLHKVDP